jgi:hypothetical protein
MYPIFSVRGVIKGVSAQAKRGEDGRGTQQRARARAERG